MGKRTRAKDDPEAVADADSRLRAMSRMFSATLAALVIRGNERIQRMDWGETQVVTRQRRLDRVLHVDVSPTRRRLLHIEWTMRLNERVRERTAEYHMESAFAARRDARCMRGNGKPRMRVSVESVIVVLTGRKKAWPKIGKYQTSPRGKRFTGVKFRIVAVYQKTVAELEQSGGPFWLAFVPLARDVDAEKLRKAVERVRSQANEEEFVEVIATMLSMAQLKKDRPEFLNVIRSAAQKEAAVRHPWFVEGREEGLGPLVYQFERRLGRSLREGERKRIALRLTKEGPEKLGAVVLDLSREELAVWLAPRKTKASKAA